MLDLEVLKEKYPNTTTKKLAELLNTTIHKVLYEAEKLDLKKDSNLSKRKYSVNSDYFSSINRKMAYVIGFIMADGCVSKNELSFCLASKDIEILENINNLLNSTYTIKNNKGYEGNIYSRLRINDKQIISDLKSYGIIERKTGSEQFPHQLIDYKWDFLRGLFDGDGTVGLYISKNNQKVRRFSIVSSNIKFINNLKTIYNCGYVHANKTQNNWIVSKKSDLHMIYQNLYQDTDLYLKRKYDKFTYLIENSPIKTVRQKRNNNDYSCNN